MPTASTALHYDTIARAIALVRAHPRRPPTSEAVVEVFGLDPAQWRRLLTDCARGGVHLTLRGTPVAPRSVGSAIAANTLVPCHRRIRADGNTGEFRWGSERKLAIRAWEAA